MSIKGGKIDASGEFIKSFRIVTDIDADAGLGTPTDPLRVDPTGTTVQPVSFTTAQHVIVDSGAGGGTQYTDGTTQATPTGTVALGKDPSNVVKSLPLTAAGALKVDNSAVTQPVSGTFWQGTQPVSGTVAATQSGTWTVQPGNTANTTAWKVDGSAVTQPVSAASLPLPSGASTSAIQSETHGTVAAGTAAAKSELVGGVVATSAPTGTVGQQMAVQLDSAGNVRVNPGGQTGAWKSSHGTGGTSTLAITFTVPSGKKWRLHNLQASLVTNATASTRNFGGYATDGTNTIAYTVSGYGQTASQTVSYSFYPGAANQTTLLGPTSNGAIAVPFPALVLGPGYTLNVFISSGQIAGDTFTANVNIEEYPD